jgi:DNA-binding Xre family transcriptional regulator
VLRAAVARRTADGVSQTELANRIGMDKSALSRILHARVQNITLRTVSDILWATEHEPTELSADALEEISPNYCPLHRRGSTLTMGSEVPHFFLHFDRHTSAEASKLGQGNGGNVKVLGLQVSTA